MTAVNTLPDAPDDLHDNLIQPATRLCARIGVPCVKIKIPHRSLGQFPIAYVYTTPLGTWCGIGADAEAAVLDAIVWAIADEPEQDTHDDIKAEVLSILNVLLDDPTREITADDLITLCRSTCPEVRDLGLRLSATLSEAAQ